MRVVLTAFLFLAAVALEAQQPPLLRNGQKVTLQGRLTMEPAGRLQFVVLQMPTRYLPVVAGEAHSESAAAPTSGIGLSGFYRYDLLYAHRGAMVTVSGTLLTDGANPYYYHSTSLQAASIRLPNGAELIGQPRAKLPIAVDVGEYTAKVLLPADLAGPWQYSARGQPDRERQFLSCSSNGGGDVVNCSCATGFHAMGAEWAAGGKRSKGTVFPDSGTAQFEVGDDARAAELSVTCSR